MVMPCEDDLARTVGETSLLEQREKRRARPIGRADCAADVLTLAGDRICAMTRFENTVLPWFGLPRSLPSR
jgi:hypothetical protein